MGKTPEDRVERSEWLVRVGRTLLQIRFIPQRYKLLSLIAKYYASANHNVHAQIGNYWVEFDLNDKFQRVICFDLHENEIKPFFQAILKPGQTFIDIGANVGYYSLVASSIVGLKGAVYAFEPVPATAAVIEKAVLQNHIDNLFVHQIALSDSPGILALYVTAKENRNSSLSSSVPNQDSLSDRIDVSKQTLDDFVDAHHIAKIDLIKIDIEGAEPYAFIGMEKTLASFSPHIISEVHPLLLRKQGMESTAITTFLSNRGYTIYQIGSHGLQLLDPNTVLDPPHIDIFATHTPQDFQQFVRPTS